MQARFSVDCSGRARFRNGADVLKLHSMSLPAVLGASLLCVVVARAQSATPAPYNGSLDVEQLFAGTCGFCHSDGGRAAGRGPQLMDSQRDDEFLHNRIKIGKQGAMPAFGESFSDAQIDQIVKYIRALKPREG
ncbi:cytochrome c [Bradyrhizobium barranii]|uniref:Cytochrome c n=1 Tax=Bradyrhizobium barranii TaxID=2992140 RepID=A0ABY3QJ36_9BRAD|nr:cytochrome c [Bradyrhizobium japonicum]UFW85878.1 cytochrome c [Bradyrhizobium japonicum]